MDLTKFKLLFLNLNLKRIMYNKKLHSRRLNRALRELMKVKSIKTSLNMISSLRDSWKLKIIISPFKYRLALSSKKL